MEMGKEAKELSSESCWRRSRRRRGTRCAEVRGDEARSSLKSLGDGRLDELGGRGGRCPAEEESSRVESRDEKREEEACERTRNARLTNQLESLCSFTRAQVQQGTVRGMTHKCGCLAWYRYKEYPRPGRQMACHT